ncbi:MAG: methylmalonyl-CoA mutase family protein, partial [Blastocatellia bacterium]
SGTAGTADPLAGSYVIEHLTNEIQRIASDYTTKIDEMGGTLRAIETGYVQREIERAAYDYQRAVDSGAQVVVGVNSFTVDEPSSIPILKIDEEMERQQSERVRAVRARRDKIAAAKSLDRIEQAARTNDNLMPLLVDAVECYATLGEISDSLRVVFGEYKGAAE